MAKSTAVGRGKLPGTGWSRPSSFFRFVALSPELRHHRAHCKMRGCTGCYSLRKAVPQVSNSQDSYLNWMMPAQVTCHGQVPNWRFSINTTTLVSRLLKQNKPLFRHQGHGFPIWRLCIFQLSVFRCQPAIWPLVVVLNPLDGLSLTLERLHVVDNRKDSEDGHQRHLRLQSPETTQSQSHC